ncbi:hypothetical protein SAICODRAFT_148389 [Saitoella complicata NRRL Y-17804]|uniref:uncharacterized protein n=1 Tax=Saitoella complicata (strain BCRC 22490 / CBS 7301 / JCM 7358 / NBRC 10748 / NRRL Y-17804) TaxID=698492 RepID=UPI0008671472|nr:uncharacterized protein SAICODRAFT_148389 [Saitoella complicata NRRL Y-17804]ODQ55563.1 hypothetical protein SAICODRAFT_148389 [Saitoella complicata NRRL Y-17804]
MMRRRWSTLSSFGSVTSTDLRPAVRRPANGMIHASESSSKLNPTSAGRLSSPKSITRRICGRPPRSLDSARVTVICVKQSLGRCFRRSSNATFHLSLS